MKLLKPIGFDIDGTLYNMEEHLHILLNRVFDTDYSKKNPFFTSYELDRLDRNPIEKDFVMWKFKDGWLCEMLNEIAPEVIREIKLMSKLRDVYFISCRGEGADTVWHRSAEFIRNVFPEANGLIHTLKEDKWKTIKGLGISLFVEDHLPTAIAIAENTDCQVILINAHYNIHEPHERIIPVDSIEDAIFIIYELWKKGVC